MTFLVTSHGKGCVDGVGCTIKRHVAQKVIQRKAVVKDRQSFYDCTTELFIPSVNTYFIDTKKINDFISKNVCMLFENVPELKGISSSHYHFVSDGKVLIKRYSGALEALNSNIIPASLQTEHTTNKCIDSKAIEVNECVKIINKPYKGFYVIVTCKSNGNELDIQYLKKPMINMF